MILEIAQIDVKPGMEAEFEAGVAKAIPIFRRAKGCRAFEAHRSIEMPTRYRLLIRWDTLEDHTVGFREGPLFNQWRAIVGPFFAAPPVVEHFTLIAKS